MGIRQGCTAAVAFAGTVLLATGLYAVSAGATDHAAMLARFTAMDSRVVLPEAGSSQMFSTELTGAELAPGAVSERVVTLENASDEAVYVQLDAIGTATQGLSRDAAPLALDVQYSVDDGNTWTDPQPASDLVSEKVRIEPQSEVRLRLRFTVTGEAALPTLALAVSFSTEPVHPYVMVAGCKVYTAPTDEARTNCTDMSLWGADFSDLDLTGADFTGSDMTNGRFDRATLDDARFDGVRALYVSFVDASMVGVRFDADSVIPYADFTRADATSAQFLDSHMAYSVFPGAVLDHTDFTDATLSFSELHEVGSYEGLLLTDADLNTANISGLDLRQVETSKVGWQAVVADGTNFSGKDLNGAWMRGASLRGAILTDVQLGRRNGVRADIAYSDLEDAILDGARVDATASHSTLIGVSAVGTDFAGSDFLFSTFEGVDFTQSTGLDAAGLENADFTRARLDGQDLTGRWMRGAIFREASLIDAVIDGADANHADFTGAVMDGISARAAKLAQGTLTDVSAVDADFTDASLRIDGISGDFTRAVFVRAVLPDASELAGVLAAGSDLREATIAGVVVTRQMLEDAGVVTDDETLFGALAAGEGE